MPPALHRHLKRGLDFGPVHIHPEDAIGDRPSAHYDTQGHEAKRRRVEAIAAQYILRGRPPLILSAGLRGPFDNGWKNPWATTTTRPMRGSSEKNSAAVIERSPAVAKQLSKVRGTVRVGARPSRRRNSGHSEKGPIASPETSRATTDALSFRDQDHSLDQVEVEIPPATAPSPTQDDASGTTEYFSANTERIIETRSPLTNPFWLRRPESERRGGVHFSQNGVAETSPTRSRSVRSNKAAAAKHKTTPVKSLIRAPIAVERTPLSEKWRSSASASMMISSPVNGPQALLPAAPQRQYQDAGDAQFNAVVPVPPIISDDSTQTVVAPNRTSHGIEAVRPVPSPSLHERRMPKTTKDHATGDAPLNREGPSPPMPPPSASTRRSARSQNIQGAVRHNRVASPAPASSTGFKYRKLSGSRCNKGEVQRHKAKAVDFDYSPATKKLASVPLDQEEPPEGNIENDADLVQARPAEHCLNPNQDDSEEQVLADDTITELQHPDQDSRQPSHESAMSTQAAMLLAQLEFQQSTCRSLSPVDAPKWSQTSDATPRSMLLVPSPAITPLSGFGTRLDNAFSNDGVPRGPLMSTQDLFGAASPFAFSTIKKRPAAPPLSGLRFGLPIPHDDDLKTDSATAKSPTPSAERIPLKAKGNTPSLWSFANEKHSQASQGSLVDRSTRSVNDVELPQLDFHTSLDDFETNGGLYFTDGFLHNLDDTT
ncbi:hypothetical protein T440DRAFT_101535 [Plenodomus tracheiphilus IPT5]|uniref:Uncharacterized protein n=1 Tax=Plenodomus tracheiphilus IPT5 TaxID=1408161 RepID=A0A6A7BN48_9PLEO|nr:hypothetical protein T440DRAFT_101535 [Plenodomus tracheiphilus IPT5]